MGVFAVCAHFMMDYPQVVEIKYEPEQEAIGNYFLNRMVKSERINYCKCL